MTTHLMPIPFYEDTLLLVGHSDEPFVAMKPVVENIGLDWKSQHVKLTEKFNSVIAEITTTGADGKQYSMTCLPLRKITAWLYSVNPNKVAPELRQKIIRYQDECDDALWDVGLGELTAAQAASTAYRCYCRVIQSSHSATACATMFSRSAT
ncbi:phage antirepressor N-terminal domain-containing protein [Glaciimonas sp. GG7]